MKRNSILLLLMVVSLLQAQVEISGSVDLLLFPQWQRFTGDNQLHQ
jgi:hypothetical protein